LEPIELASEACARVPCEGQRGSKAVLDPAIQLFGECIDNCADEGSHQRGHQQRGNDLRNESQGDLLYLRQGLQQRDYDADRHGGDHGGTGGDNNCPNRRLNDIESVRLVHQLTFTPSPSKSSLPLSKIATEPPEMMRTDVTLPLMVP